MVGEKLLATASKEKMTILKTIKEKTQLKENTNIIKEILIDLYLNDFLSTKELAHRHQIPVPLVSAIKKELTFYQLTQNTKRFGLSVRGKIYVDEQLGFKHINTTLYQQLLSDETIYDEYFKLILAKMIHIMSLRPLVNVTIDQALGTPETAVKRAFLLLDNHDLIGKKILFLGDDDLTSIAVMLLLEEITLSSIPQSKQMITLLEMDTALIAFIKEQTDHLKTNLMIHSVDFRSGNASLFNPSYEIIFTDPPYTENGLRLFLSRAVSLSFSEGSKIYLSFGSKDPETSLKIQQLMFQQHLLLKYIYSQFNQYEGASIIGGESNLYLLETTKNSRSYLSNTTEYLEPIYTGDVTPKIRDYECSHCQTVTQVGHQQVFKTIEELKQTHCPTCGNEAFILIKQTKVTLPKKEAHGYHYLIELTGCPPEKLSQVEIVEEKMLALTAIGQLNEVAHHFHQFEPFGVSGVVILSESHFTIHTWPEDGYAAIDLFICQNLINEATFFKEIENIFGAKLLTYHELFRG